MNKLRGIELCNSQVTRVSQEKVMTGSWNSFSITAKWVRAQTEARLREF